MFVLLSIGTLILGVSIYNHANMISIGNHEQRTALSYITNQVRLNDAVDNIDIKLFHNINALTLNQEIDGSVYQTLLYCYNGQLREIFTEEGIEHEPDSGVIIMPLESLNFESYGNAIKISLENPSGSKESILIRPRSF